MRQRLKRKIHHLREQPAEARRKTVSSLVITGGIGILFLWLFLLLPIQLHVQVDTDGTKGNVFTNLFKTQPSDVATNQDKNIIANPSRTPQVGGIQQYQRPLPSGPYFKTATPGPSPLNSPQEGSSVSSPTLTPTPTPKTNPR